MGEARALYEMEPSPPLLLVEANGTPEMYLSQLDSLAEVCDPNTNLIMIGECNDIDLYRALKHRGVADYLVVPCPAIRLVESILELYTDQTKIPIGRAIAFVGAKGGCGSSTLAHNVAYAIGRLTDTDVVVIDFDLAFGNADLTFNIETPHGIRNILSDTDRVDEAFLQRFTVKYGERVHLLAAATSLEGDAAINLTALEEAVEAIKRQAKFVVLDLPHVWSEWVKLALQMSEAIVVTAIPDLASVRNTRNLIDYLSTGRPLETPPLLVLNRVGAARKGEVDLKDFAQTVGLTPQVTLHEDSDAFGRAASIGKMIEEVAGRSRPAEAIRQLAMVLSETDTRKRKRSRPIKLPGLDKIKSLFAKK
ncbi:pilus assembly protein CpaE [uncultured Gammaproteobacteria bacterium]